MLIDDISADLGSSVCVCVCVQLLRCTTQGTERCVCSWYDGGKERKGGSRGPHLLAAHAA